jgi:hypothetical protein
VNRLQVTEGAKAVANRTFQLSRWHQALGLVLLAAVSLLVIGCPASQPAGGDLHLTVTTTFDDRATDDVYWHAGTLSAAGSFPAAKLDSMDIGAEYAWDLLGSTPWTASTQQQMGDFVGDCNGVKCDPCVAEFGGDWEIEAVNLTMQQRGNGRYVFKLWLGSVAPPKSGGCDTMLNEPFYWGTRLTVTLTGMDSATPIGTADDGYTVVVTKG